MASSSAPARRGRPRDRRARSTRSTTPAPPAPRNRPPTPSRAGASTGSTVQFNEIHDLGSASSTNSAIYAFAVGSTATALDATIKGNLVYNHFGNDAIKVGAKNGQDRLVSGGSVTDNVVHDTA